MFIDAPLSFPKACIRLFSSPGCSKIAATNFSSPPQFGQCSFSKTITDLRLDSPGQTTLKRPLLHSR